MNSKVNTVLAVTTFLAVSAASCRSAQSGVRDDSAATESSKDWEAAVAEHSNQMLDEGRRIFRWDTFGSEAFWGDQLQLHKAILGEKNGGVGPGLTPRHALQLGLKVDSKLIPKSVADGVKSGKVSLDDPATTVELLRLNSVVGVKGVFDGQKLVGVGLTCASCHSTVDNSFMPGIGRRLDGWPNRDLDVGQVASLAPNLKPFTDLLGVDDDTVRQVLLSWGPGKYDAELTIDGKAMRPDGKPAATSIPAAFGLAGVNLHTYTGFGSVTYWNAYVANTQMHGQGTFFDPRLADANRFPIAARAGLYDLRSGLAREAAVGGSGTVVPDKISAKLAALHFYQLSLPAPKAPAGWYDHAMAERGEQLFSTKARCATCHVPPLFTEPGHQLHTAEEIGIDDFQAKRSPEGKYRTTPLRGLFVRTKGGFYHDGRFKDYQAVIAHYDRIMVLNLSPAEQSDLVEYLKSL